MIPIYKFALVKELEERCKRHSQTNSVDSEPEDFLPCKSEPKATGWDVRYAGAEPINLIDGVYFRAPLGLRVFCPEGWWLKLVPRSSTFNTKKIHSLYGTIDETFPEEMMFCGQYCRDTGETYSEKRIEFGDRIGQLIPIRREEMVIKSISNEEFDKINTERNATRKSGFGSSGAK